ncbi:hypothetical protein SEVIR_1G227250v4 [Setaria viridis]
MIPAWIPMLWRFTRLNVAHHGAATVPARQRKQNSSTARMAASGGDRGQPSHVHSKQRRIGLRRPRRAGILGEWWRIRACLPTKPASPDGEAGGRRDPAASLSAAVDDAEKDPARGGRRRVAGFGWWRWAVVERSEGGGALSGRKAKQPDRAALGFWRRLSRAHGFL